MQVTCPQCGTRYRLDQGRLSSRRPPFIRCNACRQIIDTGFLNTPDTSASDQTRLKPRGQETLKVIRSNFKKLYPMPHVMFKARRLLTDPDVDLGDVGTVIKTDQALASRILKVTNSAYFGLNQKVSTIAHAVALLGTRMLTQIIDIVSHSKMLKEPLKAYEMPSGRIWRHSLTVAVASDAIASRTHRSSSDEAFLAGLLHDAGKIILDKCLLEHWGSFRAMLRSPDVPLTDAEESLVGLSHALAGSELCMHWNLPEPVTLGIKDHHDPTAPRANNMAAVVFLANQVAHGRLPAGAKPPDEQTAEIMTRLGLSQSELEKSALHTFQAVECLEEDTY